MRVLAVANAKGGVGKTTTTINLGAGLVEQGQRVLLADLDAQGSIAPALRLNPHQPDRTLYEVLVKGSTALDAIIVPAGRGLDVAPSSESLAYALAELPQATDRLWQWSLAEALETVAHDYDWVLVDTPPTLGALSLVALAAAEAVIVPTQLEAAAWRKTSDFIFGTVARLRDGGRRAVNPDLEVLGVLPTFVDLRPRFAQDLLAQLRGDGRFRLYQPGVKRTILLHEATLAGQSILAYAPRSQPAEAYRALTQEVLRGT